MRCRLLIIGVVAGLAWTALAADKVVNLSGTWVLDSVKGDAGGRNSAGRPHGSIGGTVGSSYPGGGYPGGGYPGGSYPGGGYPGGSYPGGGYPGGSYPGGTYPGGTYPGSTYPGGSDPGAGYPGDNIPGTGRSTGGRSGRADSSMLGLTLTIQQTEKAIQITRKFKELEGEQQVEQSFALGGQNSNPDSTGRGKYLSRSTLSKDKLVNLGTMTFETQESVRAQDVVIKEEFSLAEKGRTLIVKTTLRAPGGDSTITQVFLRQ